MELIAKTGSAAYYSDCFIYTTIKFFKGTSSYMPVFASIYGYANDIRQLVKDISKTDSNFGSRYIISSTFHQFKTEYNGNVGHITLWLKQDIKYTDGLLILYSNETLNLSTVSDVNKIPDTIVNQFFNMIHKYTDIPCLISWVPYILSESWTRCVAKFSTRSIVSGDASAHVHPICYFVNEKLIQNIISKGLQNHDISIPGGDGTCSDRLSNVTTLDDYLSEFSKELTDKIQNSFTPLFNPDKQKYDAPVEQFNEINKYRRQIHLLHNQRSVINAVCKRLNKAHSAIIVGNMGSGKSVMSIGSIYAHSRMHHKRYTNNIVLCPGHLIEKWKREIQESYPCAEVIICNGFDQFVSDVEPKLKDKTRKTNLFIVLSKDTAKGKFEEQPMAICKPYNRKRSFLFDEPLPSDNVSFYCPECGEQIHVPKSQHRRDYNLNFDFFSKKSRRNSHCPSCGASLWAPALGSKSKYLKITGLGWFDKDIIRSLYETYKDKDANTITTKTERRFMNAVIQYHNDDTLFKAPLSRKVSLAKYIYRKYRNKIDYFVGDEVHQYSASDSSQGQAFALLVRSAKHTIGLTGTLMNGYASNLFYLLFRMFSKEMVKYGYKYKDCKKFMTKYGVIEQKKMTVGGDNHKKKKVTSSTKERPGVSPVVFTDFLLNSCVFISLEYSAPYTETPIGISMDTDIEANYNNFRDSISDLVRSNIAHTYSRSNVLRNINEQSEQGRMLMQAVNQLTLYPDQPYNMDPIYNENSNKIVAQFQDIENKNRVLPKEQETLDIIDQAVSRGEHVLIYTYWTNKTDCQERLKNLITNNGYNVDILTNDIPSKKREKWIADKVKAGMQVLICNPALVETGLDLLDFTTIVFYQLGYKLTTMRQASRRSYRLNQKNPVHVYFLYYKNTAQEQALAIMSLKLHAATALEGNFSSEGLTAINSDETDILGQLAKSIVDDNKYDIDTNSFTNTNVTKEEIKIVNNNEEIKSRIFNVFQAIVPKRNASKMNITVSSVFW